MPARGLSVPDLFPSLRGFRKPAGRTGADKEGAAGELSCHNGGDGRRSVARCNEM